MTRVKVIVAVLGLVLFALGIRMDDPRWRYAGIALVAIAWLMRFVHRAPAASSRDMPNEERGQVP
jgi:small neutral amino acid transporter SnatA (MarC family)